jgi:hypothetical protein
MKLVIALIFFTILAIPGRAQYDSTSDEPPPYSDFEDSDTEGAPQPAIDPKLVTEKNGFTREPIEVKKFDQNKWKKIVGNRDYSSGVRKKKNGKEGDTEGENDYGEGGKRARGESMRDDEYQEDSSEPMSINFPGLNYIVYALAIAILIYILFLVIKNSTAKRKNTKLSKQLTVIEGTPVDNIQELEIDRLLREAMSSGNYRLAIRIYFLGLLKKLDEDRIIAWKKDKTNRDYLNEIFSKDFHYAEVKRLTLAYEEVWYGDHNLTTDSYESIINSFRDIGAKLNQNRQ